MNDKDRKGDEKELPSTEKEPTRAEKGMNRQYDKIIRQGTDKGPKRERQGPKRNRKRNENGKLICLPPTQKDQARHGAKQTLGRLDHISPGHSHFSHCSVEDESNEVPNPSVCPWLSQLMMKKTLCFACYDVTVRVRVFDTGSMPLNCGRWCSCPSVGQRMLGPH